MRRVGAGYKQHVLGRYYGCGTVLPPGLHGTSVLDLGSGSGQDCYVLSKLVGQTGRVVGLDMTEEQASRVKYEQITGK